VRLVWLRQASEDLRRLAERAPAQAVAVFNAASWLTETSTPKVGRIALPGERRYWPVPPQGIYYRVKGDDVIILAIRDARRRRKPWP
jgi:plasmid stabilization system protein ParE